MVPYGVLRCTVDCSTGLSLPVSRGVNMVKQIWLPKFLFLNSFVVNCNRNGQMDVWSGIRGKIVVVTEEERVRFTDEGTE